MTEQTRRLMAEYEEIQIRHDAQSEQLKAQALAMSLQEVNASHLPAWVKGWRERQSAGRQ